MPILVETVLKVRSGCNMREAKCLTILQGYLRFAQHLMDNEIQTVTIHGEVYWKNKELNALFLSSE